MGKERGKQGWDEKDEQADLRIRESGLRKICLRRSVLNPRDERRWDGPMGLEPENVKDRRSSRGKWASVYLAENLSGFGFSSGVRHC